MVLNDKLLIDEKKLLLIVFVPLAFNKATQWHFKWFQYYHSVGFLRHAKGRSSTNLKIMSPTIN